MCEDPRTAGYETTVEWAKELWQEKRSAGIAVLFLSTGLADGMTGAFDSKIHPGRRCPYATGRQVFPLGKRCELCGSFVYLCSAIRKSDAMTTSFSTGTGEIFRKPSDLQFFPQLEVQHLPPHGAPQIFSNASQTRHPLECQTPSRTINKGNPQSGAGIRINMRVAAILSSNGGWTACEKPYSPTLYGRIAGSRRKACWSGRYCGESGSI